MSTPQVDSRPADLTASTSPNPLYQSVIDGLDKVPGTINASYQEKEADIAPTKETEFGADYHPNQFHAQYEEAKIQPRPSGGKKQKENEVYTMTEIKSRGSKRNAALRLSSLSSEKKEPGAPSFTCGGLVAFTVLAIIAISLGVAALVLCGLVIGGAVRIGGDDLSRVSSSLLSLEQEVLMARMSSCAPSMVTTTVTVTPAPSPSPSPSPAAGPLQSLTALNLSSCTVVSEQCAIAGGGQCNITTPALPEFVMANIGARTRVAIETNCWLSVPGNPTGSTYFVRVGDQFSCKCTLEVGTGNCSFYHRECDLETVDLSPSP